MPPRFETMKPRSSSSYQSSMPPPAPTEETSVSDPFILSWGSSVNICEDLRRSIRTEIEDVIDTSIMNLQGSIKNEDRTATQLAKDLSHARAEMLELRRSADDELDGAVMKDQVRTRLKASLKAELMTPVLDVDSASPPELSEEGDTTDGRPPFTIASYIQKRASELKERAKKVVAERESLVQWKAAKDDFEGETHSLLGRIESDRLVEELAVKEKETAFRTEEHENEARRMRATKDTVQQKRAQCGQYAQQIADHTKTLTSKKTKNEAELAEVGLRLKQAEEYLRSLDSTTKLESQLASLSRQLATLNEDVDAFEAIRKAREQTKVERSEMEKESTQLVKSKEELQAQLNSAQSNHEASVTLLEEAKAIQSSVEAERMANDKVQAEQILPGHAERNTLMEEKQELARIMNKLHEVSVANESELSRDLIDQSETLKKLDEDYKLVSDELAQKHSLAESIKRAKEQADEAAQKELQEHKEFRAKFEEAVAAETERFAELKSERNRKRRERVEQARVESSRMRVELEMKLDILYLAADAIAKVEQAVQ